MLEKVDKIPDRNSVPMAVLFDFIQKHIFFGVISAWRYIHTAFLGNDPDLNKANKASASVLLICKGLIYERKPFCLHFLGPPEVYNFHVLSKSGSACAF